MITAVVVTCRQPLLMRPAISRRQHRSDSCCPLCAVQASPLRSHAERQLQRRLSPLRQAWDASPAAYVEAYNASLSTLGDHIRCDKNRGSGDGGCGVQVQLCPSVASLWVDMGRQRGLHGRAQLYIIERMADQSCHRDEGYFAKL